jgi:hypothetical protein
MTSFTRKTNRVGGVGGDIIDAGNVNELQLAFEQRAISVKDPSFGATGNGSTDDTTAIQNAITAATAAGGGVVWFPPGTYVVSNLLIDSNVWICGSGVDATVLKAKASTNTPVIQTRTLSTHTGTNDTNSEVNFKVSDLTINGNKASNAGSNGYGIRVHGANFALERLRIYDCNADGIDSEWSTSLGPPTATGMEHSMEARVVDVEVHHCDGTGIDWNGPHDSMFTNCILWENATYGVRLYLKSSGSVMTACHSWGTTQLVAFLLQGGGSRLIGCTAEGASVAQILILEDHATLAECYVLRATGGAGIYLGQTSPSSIPVSHFMIRAKLYGFASGQAIIYSNDAGSGWIEALINHTSGAYSTGTPHASSKRDIRVYGGGTGTVDV